MMLQSEVTEHMEAVDDQLRKLFGKQLFYPKADDQVRLLRLKLWSERYKVSLSYILLVLIPYFERISSKHTRKQRIGHSKGIGTTIANLTGQAAEAVLVKAIEKDYPDGENVIEWKEKFKEECLSIIENDDNDGLVTTRKSKSILAHKTLSDFRQAYEAKIMRMRNAAEKIEKEVGMQPWRGNPFR